MFACTCKNTNPNPNPKSVITKQQTAVVTISPIFLYLFLRFSRLIFLYSLPLKTSRIHRETFFKWSYLGENLKTLKNYDRIQGTERLNLLGFIKIY